jgi:hypothetical protein
VASGSFLTTATAVLDHYRNQPRIVALARVGYLCRLLWATGSDKIDDAFEEFESLLAFSLLTGQWQALVDQLYARGQHVFLSKIGFEHESARLAELAPYLERVLDVKETPDKTARINDILFGTQIVSAELRLAVDVIQNHWRDKSGPGTADGDSSIDQWAASYALPYRRPSFTADSSDSLVQRFFRDCETIIETEARMSNPDGLDEIPVWTGMAWCAYHFCVVMRKVQRGDKARGSGKVQTAQNMTDQDWLVRGIRWADKAIALADEQGKTSSLYRSVDARKRLEKLRPKQGDLRLIEELSARMLRIDAERLDTTQRPSRMNRAIVRTERSVCEVMSTWCKSFEKSVPMNSDDILGHRFALVQRLKSFNYGQITGDVGAEDVGEASPGSLADEVVDYSAAPDVFDRIDVSSGDIMNSEQTQRLYRHLRENQAAILDFITHPGSSSTDWGKADHNRWGTVCFVVRAGENGLMIRPFFLRVSEALIRLVIDGAPDQGTGSDQNGLREDLPNWPNGDGSGFPEVLRELSARLFPVDLLNELRGCRRLYLCPHRHLFQIPLHALPLGQPLFTAFDTSYVLKTAHALDLLSRPRIRPAAPARRWFAVDEPALGDGMPLVEPWVGSGNEWGRPGLQVEEFIREAASVDQAVVCCHCQLDDARPGRARFRLWGGGRLVADDIHRVARTVGNSGDLAVDLASSDWVIAACDAGSARVAMRTAPGLALSLVSCGAARVTSCLYHVRPQIAGRFLDNFLTACDRGDGAPFNAAVKETKNRGRAGWAEAASFVSYGLFHV